MLGCVDHRGTFYNSIAAMTREYGIREDTYCSRRKRGWSLKNALCKPVSSVKSSRVSVRDHLGKEYKTIRKMLDAWGITYSAYYNRLHRGWDLEKVLTTPISRKRSNVGNEQKIDTEMLEV